MEIVDVMKRMVVEIQELQKVVAGHQEAAAIEQRDAITRKWIEVCFVVRKENLL